MHHAYQRGIFAERFFQRAELHRAVVIEPDQDDLRIGRGFQRAKDLVNGGVFADGGDDAPLFAKGFVLLGAGKPVVVAALDWCQCNNDSYDRWREALAEAAGTVPKRVMLATVHQHDAPICDLTAQRFLDQHGLKGWNCDPEFHETAVRRAAAALKAALKSSRRVTHYGIGQAKVDQLASNRRVVRPDGKITWERGSSSGNIFNAPEGEVDPWLKSISLWDGDAPVLTWSCYAVHPMSHYGKGQVSADFPGLARSRRQPFYCPT